MNKITFDTVHISSSDIEIINDHSIFKTSNHVISIKDLLEYKADQNAFLFTYHTTHKLFDKKCNTAIELTIASIFRPHNIPPSLMDCEEMAKCHFFHTEAILSEKSKTQQIICFTDIFLFPEDAKIELRGKKVFNESQEWLKPYL